MFRAHRLDHNSLTLDAQPDSGVGMLVVIDPAVADYKMLAAGVRPGAQTIVLEPHRDAIEQITMALARHREHESLHIVCHGAPGKLYLGKTCLSADNLAPYRQQLLEWGVGEILLYSCEVAVRNVGTDFVEQLSRLTGADIAASSRRVGNAALGGSWCLESYCGEVSAGLAFVPDVVRKYSGVFMDFGNSDPLLDIDDLDLSDSDDDINNYGFLFNYNGYLTEPSDEDPLEIALDFLSENYELLGLTAADVQNPIVTNQHVTQHNGATHIYLAQELNGEKVFDGNMSLTVTNDGRVLSVGNRFGNNLAENFNTTVPRLSPASAVEAAAADLGLTFDSPPQEIFFFAPVPQDFTFDGGNVSRDNIPVTLMYDIGDNGTASLVWNTVINTTNSDDWWEMNVDAVTGDVLQKVNWTNDANYKVYAHAHEHPEDPLYGTGTFDFRTIEGDPHDPIASPFGWHDTDGALGAEYTDTRGNNVFAQEDRDGNNMGGYRPDGGNALNFDFPLDLSSNPIGYQDAAITNLFYWNNKLHDIFFHYGFDEEAGNFQETHYTAPPPWSW